MDEVLTIEHFQPLVGRKFRIKETPFTFELNRIHTSGQPLVEAAQRIAFTLIFRDDRKEYYLNPGLYECEVEDGPTWPIYIMPMQTQDPALQEYQALFD